MRKRKKAVACKTIGVRVTVKESARIDQYADILSGPYRSKSAVIRQLILKGMEAVDREQAILKEHQ